MKEKREDGLQSRREFFRKAAKAALPILGAVVLANTPLKAIASENGMESGRCTACSGANCGITCRGLCRDNCEGTCKNTCRGSSR